MGHGIHTYFKPSRLFNSIHEVYDFCKHGLNQYNPVEMDNFIAFDRWCFMLDFPINCYDDSTFPYLKLYAQGRLDLLVNELECRNDMKTICEAFGAEDWWTCDECSDDDICDLRSGEFERVLKTRSVEYERFLMPTFRWPEDCCFIHDSRRKILIT